MKRMIVAFLPLTVFFFIQAHAQREFDEFEVQWKDPIQLWDTLRKNRVGVMTSNIVMYRDRNTLLRYGGRDSVYEQYTYQDQRLLSVHHDFEATGRNSRKWTYSYDSRNRLIQVDEVEIEGNPKGAIHYPIKRKTVAYHPTGVADTVTEFRYLPAGKRWEPLRKEVSIYDSVGVSFKYFYTFINKHWVAYARVEFNYSANKLLLSKDSVRAPFDLAQTKYQTHYTYDNNGRVTAERFDEVNVNGIEPKWRVTFEYVDGFLSKQTYTELNGTFWHPISAVWWVPKSGGSTTILDEAQARFELNAYPSPATNTLHWEVVGSASDASCAVKLHDVSGNMLVCDSTGSIDVSALPGGVYLLVYFSPKGQLGYRRVQVL